MRPRNFLKQFPRPWYLLRQFFQRADSVNHMVSQFRLPLKFFVGEVRHVFSYPLKLFVIFFLAASLSSCSFNLEEKHFVLAEEFLRLGQYRRAIEEYSRVVNYGKNSPLAVQAELQIATIYDQTLRDYPMAIRTYRDVVKRTDDRALQMRALWAVCIIYAEKLERSSIAAEEYDKLFNQYGKEQKEGPEIMLAWAKTIMDSGEFVAAAKKYEEFRTLYPGHKDGPRTLFEEAQAYLADRQFEVAATKYQGVISKFAGNSNYDPLVGEAYYGLGSSFEGMSKMDDAINAYKQSLPLYPNKKVIELKIERVQKRKKEKAILK